MLFYGENYLSVCNLLNKANKITYEIGLLEEKCDTFSTALHFNNLLEDGKKFRKMDALALLFQEASYVVDVFYNGSSSGNSPYSLQSYVEELERITKEINSTMHELEELGLN